MRSARTFVMAILVPSSLLFVPETSWSGPNAGGVLILHAPVGVVETQCSFSGLDDCNSANVRVEGSDLVPVFLLAAFPSESSPRLAGVALGIDYDPEKVLLAEWGACGDFELHQDEWPAPNTGIAVTWFDGNTQTDHLVEILWFAAYGIGDPGTLDARGHPNGGGAFADDDIPANLDPIADYGKLGFGMDGYLPCPDATPVVPTSWGLVKATYGQPE